MSPRCQSRGSTESVPVAPPRCPSNDEAALYAERSVNLLRGLTALPTNALSPVGITLPATLPPAAAAALLPPNSAAMAAYLAAQHSHRLMMTSPLPPSFARGAVSPLITSSTSPPGIHLLPTTSGQMSPPTSIPMQSPVNNDNGILDFSTKRPPPAKSVDSNDGEDAMNLSKPSTPTESGAPLDLSVSSRKRSSDEISPQPVRKQSRSQGDYKPPVVSPWNSPVTPHLPYFAAAVAAASLSPKNASLLSNVDPQLWNGKLKHSGPSPNDATKALEKMSELSKLGGEDLFRSMANSTSSSISNPSSGNRHSAWQSHWLNKGAEQAKDVLKCVWCKQSFPSLAAMTTHMKEAKHCGVNVPVPPMSAPLSSPQLPPHSSPSLTNHSPSNSSNSSNSKPSQSDLNLLIKETMPLPRKLVRGQDVWLGKGAEQTRQILKCMWCGQSFRSLAEMTNHMQQTQHYTNIISQEQIISWKSSDDSKGGPGSGSGSGAASSGPGGASSHVSAVLTCKVCDQAFSSLKELSNHMVKNSHYKEHIMRSITESGGRRRQTREKRKKSLPVRKLLELERAQHDFKNGDSGNGGMKIPREQSLAGRISCEKCGEKIETSMFVDHIRQCVGGGTLGANQRNFLKNALMSDNIIPPGNMVVGHVTPTLRDDRKSVSDESVSPGSRHHRSPSSATDLSTKETNQSEGTNSSPSVLNAIEKLIEKSFDSRNRQNAANFGGGNTPIQPQAPIGSSILKRLGIDESVDYTKPLVDAQTMNLLRNYHNHQHSQHYGRRERSGSESSSMSERGSRVDTMTPDRKMDPPSTTPRTTPDKRVQTPLSDKDEVENLTIKKEVMDEDDRVMDRVMIKKERMDEDEEDDRGSYHSRVDRNDDEEDVKRNITMPSPSASPRRQPTPSAEQALPPSSPCRTSSPASSDRSGTPRSVIGSAEKKTGGSLGALSSMFDSLSGGGSNSNNNESSTSRRTSSHPLAALQKLCDKTETHHTNQRSSQTPNSNLPSTSQALPQTSQPSTPNPGAILAFSWACNDAVMTSDSIMKCAFCDTPFISKGAYRHHLSKMHFVKDGAIPDPVGLKSNSGNGSGKNTPVTSIASGSGTSGNSTTVSAGAKSPPQPQQSSSSNFEESPHSKFLKYTELAKQLSSKYV